MRTARTISSMHYYHVTARGVGRHILFEDDKDYEIYLDLLSRFTKKHNVSVLAWCLMDNHVHLLLNAPISDISAALRSTHSIYALRFNRRHDHVGHLFQGRFGSKAIVDESYLLTVFRYIHQNPEKALLGSMELYPWSSYHEYFGKAAKKHCICNTTIILRLLGETHPLARYRNKPNFDSQGIPEDPALDQIKINAILESAKAAVGEAALTQLPNMDKAERNKILAALKDAGLSIRQIERITGIGRNIIARAK